MEINLLSFSILRGGWLPGLARRAASETQQLICLLRLGTTNADVTQHVALTTKKIRAWHQVLWYEAACFVSTSASSSCPN